MLSETSNRAEMELTHVHLRMTFYSITMPFDTDKWSVSYFVRRSRFLFHFTIKFSYLAALEKQTTPPHNMRIDEAIFCAMLLLLFFVASRAPVGGCLCELVCLLCCFVIFCLRCSVTRCLLRILFIWHVV